MLRSRCADEIHGWLDQVHVPGGAHECHREHECSDPIDDRSRKGNGKLPDSLVRGFLAFGIGVREQSADRQHQYGAQLQPQPCRHQQAGNFTHHQRDDQHHEESQAATNAIGGSEAQAHDGEQQEKRVNTQFHTHPSS